MATLTDKEHRQIWKRRLSSQERTHLEWVLTKARHDLWTDEIEEADAAFLTALGVDFSALKADYDGDSPDLYDGEELDWSWKPIPPEFKHAERYNVTRTTPVAGDRVHRIWSAYPGTVRGSVPSGRGYLVKVLWDAGLSTEVPANQLILIKP